MAMQFKQTSLSNEHPMTYGDPIVRKLGIGLLLILGLLSIGVSVGIGVGSIADHRYFPSNNRTFPGYANSNASTKHKRLDENNAPAWLPEPNKTIFAKEELKKSS